jgi:hypothetical protein
MSNSFIKEQISLKKRDDPYRVKSGSIKFSVTNFDNFPYQNWYQGDYTSDYPVIHDRPVGWRKVKIHQPSTTLYAPQLSHMKFQGSCTK